MTFWDSAIEQSIELNNFHADMTTWLKYLLITALLLAAELVYFRIADKCNIIDKPNQRSSHSSIVLRGGGIIFVLGLWIWAAFFGFHNIWFLRSGIYPALPHRLAHSRYGRRDISHTPAGLWRGWMPYHMPSHPAA